MIDARTFIEAARELGFGLYTGVPCSYLTPFINYVINASPGPAGAGGPAALRYVGAANEGDAVAIAAGAELGGQRAVVMFQNSGLGNAVNPLTSLTWTFRIPVLLIVTWRGEPGGPADEPQHELMGRITPAMLDLMGIPWAEFPRDERGVGEVLRRAAAHMEEQRTPFALIMRKGSVAAEPLEPRSSDARPCTITGTTPSRAQATRAAMLRAVQAAANEDDILVATTGYTGRELYACADRPSQLYLVGSMGCAVSVGLGLALARPDRRIVVLDGDGAVLMRLGALSTVAAQAPANLVHVLLDNGMHESTGGQATVSRNVDFCALAAASGYPHAMVAAAPDELRQALSRRVAGLRFIHVPIVPGVAPELPRPKIEPAAVAARLRQYLGPRSP